MSVQGRSSRADQPQGAREDVNINRSRAEGERIGDDRRPLARLDMHPSSAPAVDLRSVALPLVCEVMDHRRNRDPVISLDRDHVEQPVGRVSVGRDVKAEAVERQVGNEELRERQLSAVVSGITTCT